MHGGGKEGERTVSGGCDPQVYLFDHLPAPVILTNEKTSPSAGFLTSFERVGGLVDTLQPEDTLSRFGNLRSAKDWRMRPNLGQAGGNDLINPLPCHIQCPRKHPPPLGLTHRGEGVRSQRNA